VNGWRKTMFGARAQVVVGTFVSIVSFGFWALGLVRVPGAWAWPWNWSVQAYIFHASMFALVVASFAIIATGLGYLAMERVEAQVGE
jgi:hypothetical protein